MTGRGGGGPRDPRGPRTSPRPRGPGPWGTWQGGLGVCIVVVGTAAGAVGTVLTKSAPGFLLGLLVVVSTVAAALAVRPRAGRMILPVPALAYLVAALVSGLIFDRAADSSRTALALAAAQWVANGFFAMALATVLAVVITATRWYLWHRSRRARSAQADPGYPTRYAGPGRGERGGAGDATEVWGEPGSRGPGPGPWPGSGPYNFSSGA